jgi:hypothetical protein
MGWVSQVKHRRDMFHNMSYANYLPRGSELGLPMPALIGIFCKYNLTVNRRIFESREAIMPTIFKLTNVHSNLFLDVPLDKAPIAGPKQFGNSPGTPIQQWTAGGNQEWTLLQPGYLPALQIIHHVSGLVIGVTSESEGYVELQTNLIPSPGTNVQETPAIDQQLWLPIYPNIYNPSGFNFVNQFSGLVLDVPLEMAIGKDGTAPGLPIQQFSNNSGLNQQWTFTQAPGHTLPQLAISPTASVGGQSTLQLTGIGFTSWAGQNVAIKFFGGALNEGSVPVTVPVEKDGSFSVPYGTSPSDATVTQTFAETHWVSCFVFDLNGGLLAIEGLQLLYFVSTGG